MEFVEEDDGGTAVGQMRMLEAVGEVVFEAVMVAEVYGEEAVLQLQQLHQSLHQRGLAHAGHAPEVYNARPFLLTGQQVPRSEVLEQLVDLRVDAHKLGFELVGGGAELRIAAGQFGFRKEVACFHGGKATAGSRHFLAGS